jgi:GNAT superfamily N-acetyltransferase
MPHEARRGEFLVSTDPALIDLDAVHAVLTKIYWCEGIPKETVRRGIEGSISFGVYDTSRGRGGVVRGGGAEPSPFQVGFARVITDKATFAYLSDVFIVEAYRGRGLSTWLMEVILGHPELQGLRRFCLLTRDAHGLYERFGFGPLPDARMYMEIKDLDVYKRQGRAG